MINFIDKIKAVYTVNLCFVLKYSLVPNICILENKKLQIHSIFNEYKRTAKQKH